ncbi:MAG: hypothetical protein U0802_18620 [Candidatus Binatia bacterium]
MPKPYVNVPDTVSPRAQEFLRALPDPALKPQFPDADDIAGWKKLQAWAEADGRAKSDALLKRYQYGAIAAAGRRAGVGRAAEGAGRTTASCWSTPMAART